MQLSYHNNRDKINNFIQKLKKIIHKILRTKKIEICKICIILLINNNTSKDKKCYIILNGINSNNNNLKIIKLFKNCNNKLIL